MECIVVGLTAEPYDYYLRTPFLRMSNSVEVSSFFASCLLAFLMLVSLQFSRIHYGYIFKSSKQDKIRIPRKGNKVCQIQNVRS